MDEKAVVVFLSEDAAGKIEKMLGDLSLETLSQVLSWQLEASIGESYLKYLKRKEL